jgi:SAM-dependent methyltransferase
MTQPPASTPPPESRTPFDWEARFAADDVPWERGGVHPAVAHWIESGALEPGARIYVPGCGRGLEPAALAAVGLEVTASDITPSAAAFQAETLKGFDHAQMIEGDSLAWRPGAPFDALYEQTFLCAIHPRQRHAYEAMAFEILKPGGTLLALFMQKNETGGPPYGCLMPAMRELFPDQRWIWPDEETFTPFAHPRLGGKAELGGVLVRRP